MTKIPSTWPHARGGDAPLAIKTRALVKSFRGTRALDGLELRVPEGAVYLLVGPNGAGKTTALKVLMDLVAPGAGEVELLGRSPATDGAGLRARVGYVPEQHDQAYPWMTVGRLLEEHGRYYSSWDPDYAGRLTRTLDLPLARRFGTLSKGVARRVQLAMALAHRPPLLLLDEPTDGLDPLARDDFLALLADHVASSPTTILISTHHVQEMDGLADQVGVLCRGRLVAQLSCEALRATLQLYRGEVPEGWSGAPEVEPDAVHRIAQGREIQWTVWGEPAQVAERLERSGVTLRSTETLSLEGACRALLRAEGER
jgi:ABC-2 type transport system ATP-binding protein